MVGNHFNDERVFALTERGIPAVVVPGFIKDSPRNPFSVNSENYAPNYQAVRHLIGLGHRRIAYLLGHRNSRYSIERLDAYRDAHRDCGLEAREEYTPFSDFTVADGFRLMGELLDLPQPPTAVVCINDSISMGALNLVKARNLRLPQDLSMVVTCASDILDQYDPPLSMIKVPVVSVGKTAAATLVRMLETGNAPEERPSIPSTFTPRDSTGPCPKTR